jgi:uncharacterized protein YcaQ
MQTITKQQARRFILAKQGLIGAYRFCGKSGAYDFVRQAGCIQYDPVDVCGKNAELTLQSRVKGFSKSMLQELLYEDRKLVDYADKELSIWPSEDWPYFSSYRERSLELGKTFQGLKEMEKKALSYIGENGPVSSDMLPVEGEIFWHSSMHWSGNWQKKSQAARSVLEQLYTDGKLIIHHKKGSRKYYDLAERHLPESVLMAKNPCKGENEFKTWRVLRRIGAVGLLWDKNSTAFLGIDINAEERKKILDSLSSQGKIRPVTVQGIRQTFYYRSEDEPLMKAVLEGEADLKPRMSFIAPLDPLMWDKSLISALWDYQYSWEIYTPAVKRKYGYYTLPILYGDRFVGRIEVVPDRKNRILVVKGLWWEAGVRQTKKLQKALDQTLNRFAKFNDCDGVSASQLLEQFDFRTIKQEEADEAAEIERNCFPPQEACTPQRMKARIGVAADLFLVAIDRESGKMAGFVNGIATDETKLRDEFFVDAGLHDPNGKNIMILGVDMLPQYRGRGLARELVSRYCTRELERSREKLVLTCLSDKVAMYEKFGFQDLGDSMSQWGGEKWHEMNRVLR